MSSAVGAEDVGVQTDDGEEYVDNQEGQRGSGSDEGYDDHRFDEQLVTQFLPGSSGSDDDNSEGKSWR